MTDQYRVGRRCPWNVYRINPANENRDHDDRFAVTFDPADGPLVAAAINAYEGATNPAAKDAEIDDWKRRAAAIDDLFGPAPLDGRLTDADDYGRDYDAQAHALGLPEVGEAGEPGLIEAGQVWLSKTDPLQLHRIVIDRSEMEHPDDTLAFVFAHNKRTGRRTRLRAGVLRQYYRLEDPGGGDHG